MSEHPKCFAETLLLNSKDPIGNPNSQNIKGEWISKQQGPRGGKETKENPNPKRGKQQRPRGENLRKKKPKTPEPFTWRPASIRPSPPPPRHFVSTSPSFLLSISCAYWWNVVRVGRDWFAELKVECESLRDWKKREVRNVWMMEIERWRFELVRWERVRETIAVETSFCCFHFLFFLFFN